MRKYNSNVRKKLKYYLSRRLGLKKSTKGYIRGDCPFCNGSNTFGVNVINNYAHCFKCEYKSSPIDVIIELENFTSRAQAWEHIGALSGSTIEVIDTLNGLSSKRTKNNDSPKSVELPEGYQLISLPKGRLGKRAIKFLEGRGFDINDLSRKGVGYCNNGRYKGYIIIPFYISGKLSYYISRTFIKSKHPKFINPPTEDFGIGKTQLIYNQDSLSIYRKIYIVESVTNAWTIGDNAIAIMGKSISRYQLNKVINSPSDRVVIALDDDAYKEALELCMELSKHKQVKLVEMPKGKDVNDIGNKAFMDRESQYDYEDYSGFLAKKMTLDFETSQYTYL